MTDAMTDSVTLTARHVPLRMVAALVCVACGPTYTTYESASGGTDTSDFELSAGPELRDTDGQTDGDTDGTEVNNGVIVCASIPPGGDTQAGGERSALGFPEYRCSPRDSGIPQGADYQCCSVDPATENGALPNYGQDIGGGTPYFSADNNATGTWGICTRTADLAPNSTLSQPAAQGCPLPCNPTWDPAQVAVVCGAQRACCQTHEVKPADCVLDEVTGLWRAVNGHDIGVSTDWSRSAHATHQDPDGVGCAMIANGDTTSAVFVDCVRQLSVADQRGQCTTLAAEQVCPHAQVAYVDACEAMTG